MTKKQRPPKTKNVKPEAGQVWIPRDPRLAQDPREVVSTYGVGKGCKVTLKNKVTGKPSRVSIATLYSDYAFSPGDTSAETTPASETTETTPTEAVTNPSGGMPW